MNYRAARAFPIRLTSFCLANLLLTSPVLLIGQAYAQNQTRPQDNKTPLDPDKESKKRQQEKTPSSPITDAVKEKEKQETRPIPSPGALPDYTKSVDPQSQREPRLVTETLPLFGYNIFTPARDLVRKRRAALFSLGMERARPEEDVRDTTARRPKRDGTTDERDNDPMRPRTKKPRKPYTSEELAAVAKLTDAQKLDILRKALQNRLSDDDRKKYRALIEQDEDEPRDEVDPASLLTPKERLDLLQRNRDDDLTQEERRKYRLFLAPKKAPNTLESDPSELLTTDEKIELLQKQRDGRLTEEERQKYRLFLTPKKSEDDTTDAELLQRTGTRRPDNRRPRRNPTDAGIQPRDDTTNATESAVPVRSPRLEEPTTSLRTTIDAYNEQADSFAQAYGNVLADPPANYQLFGGDSLTVRYGSPTLETRQVTLTLDRTGSVVVPGAGRQIVLAGKTLQQAEQTLQQELTRIYRNVTVSVATRKLRTIGVTLSGYAFDPGPQQVSALFTASGLLIARGGPTDEGSLRRIEVIRRGVRVGTIDFYKFLVTGDKSADIPLEPGDVVNIPKRINSITVRGEVARPAIYELLPGETLMDALRFAEGVKPSGVAQSLQISTVKPGQERVLKNIDATNTREATATPLYDGDIVEALSIRNDLVNKVAADGAVTQPADYAITPGMTVADLVNRARGLTPDAYPVRAYLYRVNADNTTTQIAVDLEKALAAPTDKTVNIPLVRWDRLKVFTRQEVAFVGKREVVARGAVLREGRYPYSDNMRVADLLRYAGGTATDAYLDEAYVLHTRLDGTQRYDFVNIPAALRDDPKNNVPLEDRDQLFVYKQSEAHFTPEHLIEIRGEVNTPGKYPRGEGMTLAQALKLAGGPTPKAGDQVRVARARTERNEPASVVTISASGTLTNDLPLRDGDVITIQGRGDYRDKPYVVNVKGAVNRPGPITLNGSRVRLTDVIRAAGGLREDAFPEGVEFTRSPELLATSGQEDIANLIARVTDTLNQSQYRRELAFSDIEKIKAVGEATRSNASFSIPGVNLPLGGDTGSSNVAATTGSNKIFERDLVSPPRSLNAIDLQPSGNVAVNLAAALKVPGGADDILMVDGDTVTVPEEPTTVQVIGAVIRPTAVLFRKDKSLDDYIAESGGLAPDAAKKEKILVVRLGGGLTPVNKIKQFRQGDLILVPTRVVSERLTSKRGDIDAIFRSLTSTALIILVAKKVLGI